MRAKACRKTFRFPASHAVVTDIIEITWINGALMRRRRKLSGALTPRRPPPCLTSPMSLSACHSSRRKYSATSRATSGRCVVGWLPRRIPCFVGQRAAIRGAIFYTGFLYWGLKIGPKPAKLGFPSTLGSARIPSPDTIS